MSFFIKVARSLKRTQFAERCLGRKSKVFFKWLRFIFVDQFFSETSVFLLTGRFLCWKVEIYSERSSFTLTRIYLLFVKKDIFILKLGNFLSQRTRILFLKINIFMPTAWMLFFWVDYLLIEILVQLTIQDTAYKIFGTK